MPEFQKLMPGQIRFTPPQYFHSPTDSFVWYRCYCPITGTMRRKKHKIRRIKNLRERRKEANKMIHRLYKALENGYNPWIEQESANAFATIDEVFDRFLKFKQRDHATGGLRTDSLRTDTSFINVLRQWLGKEHPDLRYVLELKRAQLIQYLDHMYLVKEVSARTRNNHRDFLIKLGKWMVNQEYCKANPAEGITKVREGARIRKKITPENKVLLKEYLNKIDPNYLRLCMTAYYCLIRRKEICYLKVGDLFIDRGYIHVGGDVAKNRKARAATIPKVFEAELKKLIHKDYPKEYYLFSENNFSPGPGMLNPKKITDTWTRYRKKIPLPLDNQFYSLRETGITDMVHSMDAHTVRDHADHHSLEITNGYISSDMKRASHIIREKVKEFTAAE